MDIFVQIESIFYDHQAIEVCVRSLCIYTLTEGTLFWMPNSVEHFLLLFTFSYVHNIQNYAQPYTINYDLFPLKSVLHIFLYYQKVGWLVIFSKSAFFTCPTIEISDKIMQTSFIWWYAVIFSPLVKEYHSQGLSKASFWRHLAWPEWNGFVTIHQFSVYYVLLQSDLISVRKNTFTRKRTPPKPSPCLDFFFFFSCDSEFYRLWKISQ